MPCYRPIDAWQYPNPHPDTGKRRLSFKPIAGEFLQVPCGQCIGCRLDRSRMWAVRCVHEASLHDRNCFLTLTYDDEHLPADRSVNVKHFQDFMKRLRKHTGAKIRYFHCGEYGGQTLRPHYHAILFGFDFDDKELFKVSDSSRLYRSPLLERLWSFGFCTIGDVTFQSAAYVARYVLKKINGEEAENHYTRYNDLTGELWRVAPEYITMSRRPGIGHGWLQKYSSDVWPDDFIVVDGKKIRVPRYYDNQLVDEDLALIKADRKDRALEHLDNNTPERLKVRERVQEERAKQLKRGLYDGT